VSMNAHDGQTYFSAGASVPVTPGAALMFGQIIQSGPDNQVYLANLTNNYLNGTSWNVGGCVLVCLGVSHSYGIGTAIEWGVSPSVISSLSGGTGVAKPVGNLFLISPNAGGGK